MGVPSFFKWLVGKYPNIVVPAKEDDGGAGAGASSPSSPWDEPAAGPNGVYHNLYLDMNAIIHPCFHPEDEVCPPTTFDEVFAAMFEYIDRLFRIVRPTKLLYLAVDGVAPRAKMNQQRSRRFKAAKEAKDAELEEKLLREKFRAEGREVRARPRETHEVSDPNIITPGTEFMEKLSKALEYYVRSRLNSDPGWKGIKVILSDSNVPGEGEHKVMSFIRGQRSLASYDPNTMHCLYGLDADLIMLALASHELHFSILREDGSRQSQPEKCISLSNEMLKTEDSSRKCRGWFPQVIETTPKKPYQFVNIWVLREYLELDLKIPNPVVKTDIERLIDDFIFICFLTGNDFIPRIPSVEIHEGAIDLLLEAYKQTFNKMGGYIVSTEKLKDKHAAYLKVSRLEKFFHELSLCEEKIFLKRYDLRESLQRKFLRQAAEECKETNYDTMEENTDGLNLTAKSFSTNCSISTYSQDESDVKANTLELRRNLKDALRNKQDLIKSGSCKHDMIRLGLAGWKSRYYREKFGVEKLSEVGKLKNDMVQRYMEGLCWVLQYYFTDVPSWSWYYPYYHAPFASDFKGLSQFKICFTTDKPLKPFDQLMAVLPKESSCALPKCYRELMENEESLVQKFYPSDLQIDTHGKRFLWQGIAMLPFIDEKLLVSATKTVEGKLAVHEINRNAVRQEKIFMRNSNTTVPNGSAFSKAFDCSSKKLWLDPSTSELGGWLSPVDDKDTSSGFFHSSVMRDLPDIRNDQTISFLFSNPEAVETIPRLLDDVKKPEKTITETEISKRPLWHTYPGCRLPETNPSVLEPQPMVSSFGRGRGRATAAETMLGGGGRGYGRSFHGAESSQTQSRGSRNDGNSYAGRGTYGGGFQRQQTAWRPAGDAGGRGGSEQRRGW
ncbi:5'-3' exoribonuclease 2 [Zea mays]|uniref:5'-3' exoribonuclease n=2 Tax=Zea mays TaxID=4577 RepID=A0A804NZB2_MAIZE|nr:5'-3' exoribonuclease 2 [Zea mays]|eukprot:XP_008679449.1 5'-3' exoribonuclease 2 [Zea mays]